LAVFPAGAVATFDGRSMRRSMQRYVANLAVWFQ